MRHRLPLAASGLLLAALVPAGALLFVDPFTPHRRLSDGTALYLETVTWGSETRRWIGGPPWRRMVGSVLPAPALKRLDWKVTELGDQRGDLTFWLRWTGSPAAQHARTLEAFDETGHSACYSFWFDGYWTDGIEPARLHAFPRRGKMVGIRLWARLPGGGWAQEAEFVRPNPAPGPHPTWTAEPLPASRRLRGVAVTLRDFSLQSRRRAGEPVPTQTHLIARFRVTGDNQPEGAWEPVDVRLRDATGNSFEFLNYRQQASWPGWAAGARRPAPLRGWRDFWGGASGVVSGETFRVRARLVKSRTARFTREETWTLRDIPLPGPRQHWTPLGAFRRAGVSVQVVGAGGPFRDRDAFRRHSAILRLRVNRTGDERVIALRATDDRGRPVAVAGYAESGDWPIGLGVEPDARKVNVTFAVQKPLVVEYVVPGIQGREPGRQ